MTPTDLAELLRNARREARLTQEHVALFIGVHSDRIGTWERGESLKNVSSYLSALEACGLEVVVRRMR